MKLFRLIKCQCFIDWWQWSVKCYVLGFVSIAVCIRTHTHHRHYCIDYVNMYFFFRGKMSEQVNAMHMITPVLNYVSRFQCKILQSWHWIMPKLEHWEQLLRTYCSIIIIAFHKFGDIVLLVSMMHSMLFRLAIDPGTPAKILPRMKLWTLFYYYQLVFMMRNFFLADSYINMNAFYPTPATFDVNIIFFGKSLLRRSNTSEMLILNRIGNTTLKLIIHIFLCPITSYRFDSCLNQYYHIFIGYQCVEIYYHFSICLNYKMVFVFTFHIYFVFIHFL